MKAATWYLRWIVWWSACNSLSKRDWYF